MLIAAQRLLDRLRQPRSRADDLADVRTRLVAEAGASSGERAAALAVRALVAELAAAQAAGGMRSCAGCATGRAEPHGHWPGGFCCGGPTNGVFTDDELAALRLAGTTPRDLTPPSGDHAGCAFRGATGCSLAVAHRPSICVHYVCRELAAEIARTPGALPRIDALAGRLAAAFAHFSRLRRERIAAKAWEPEI